jgi:hypothetical protein
MTIAFDLQDYGCTISIDTKQIYPILNKVSRFDLCADNMNVLSKLLTERPR